jgi:uncharacterized protein YndB with AHSA1/START domain
MTTDTNKATVTLTGETGMHIERIFDAPRERVFAAFTDPELIPQWWGAATRRSSSTWSR